MILLVPDKFKGTFTAPQIAEMFRDAIRRSGNTSEEIVSIPLADGGEGSLEVFLQNYPGASEVWVDTKDPLMRDIVVPMAVSYDTVFIEMARCCGLIMIDQSERNPLKTTTYGLGLMLLAALDYSPRRIIVGVGGSATNDGGRGMIEAIGLENLHHFDDIEVQVACDARNPLTGPHGATYTYGPQKGADEKMLPVLEQRMLEWVDTAREWLHQIGHDDRFDFDTVPGGGTAGGTGAALYAFFRAKPVHGFTMFSEMVSLEDKIRASRMVITGEGCLDASSMNGKLVGSLAEMCEKICRRLYVISGRNTLGSHPSICDTALLATDFEEKIGKWCRADWRSDYLPSEGTLFGDTAAGYGVIAGCDEAGRGPLVGPVYAAAVILPEGFYHPLLKDSKKMTAAQRETMCEIIINEAVAWGVASVSAAEIDRINILQASIKAMQEALKGIRTDYDIAPDLILVDGNRFKPYYDTDGRRIPHKCIVKGDDKVPEISAASILAKTYRDKFMLRLAEEYPQYGWAHNMGYPTEEHRAAIRLHGLSPYHRKSFTVK